MNQFIGIGRLSRNADLNYTKGGTAFARFSICIDKRWKDSNGEYQNKPHFFDCVLWGKYAEKMHQYLTKGKQIAVKAELEQNTWTDGSNIKHYSVQLNVDELQLLSSPKGEGGIKNEPKSENGNGKSPAEDDIPF